MKSHGWPWPSSGAGLDAQVRVVSMPSCEIFRAQPDSYKSELLPADAPRRERERESWEQLKCGCILMGDPQADIVSVGICVHQPL